MFNTVKFLEALGEKPALRSARELEFALADAGLPPAAASALLRGDAGALNRLLGGRARMVCNVVLPENDEPQREDDTDGNGDSELPETNLKVA